jgi:hypothetical protein
VMASFGDGFPLGTDKLYYHGRRDADDYGRCGRREHPPRTARSY